MNWTEKEILEILHMSEVAHFDIRTSTLGIGLLDCVDSSYERLKQKIYDKVCKKAERIAPAAEEIEARIGIPLINKRISITPVSLLVQNHPNEDFSEIAEVLDKAAKKVGVDFLGGYSAIGQKGFTDNELRFLDSIPDALARSDRICSSVSLASTKAGINMDGILKMAGIIKATAERTRDRGGIGCAKLVVFANIPEDNPFMAGAMLGVSEPEVVLNVGISGPGVILDAIKTIGGQANFRELSETIKRLAFKVTRAGELVGRLMSQKLDVPFGIIDISLAPTPAEGDSIAEILEAMGLEKAGTHGSTAALALLNDCVKKGGTMASSSVGGMSGAFIPVSEDSEMTRCAAVGAISIDKLEAMTAVCSVGLDMIGIPGDTPVETIAAIIADELSIGVINNKTTAVRILPIPGKREGESVEFGGLLGNVVVMPVNKYKSEVFIRRGGHIPGPLSGLTN